MKVKFVYIFVYGVGYNFVQLVFKVFDFVFFEVVFEQKDLDFEFLMVKYLNFEEGKGVLILFFVLVDKIKVRIVLVNDLDVDRFVVVEK